MKKSKKIKTQKGFSLLEMLTSIAIFSIVITATVGAFATVVKARKNIRERQVNLEASRTALEFVEKTIRMSSRLDEVTGEKQITMLNNSQNKCISYKFDDDAETLEAAEFDHNTASEDECDTPSNYDSHNWITLVSEAKGDFSVTPTDTAYGSETVGKATILIKTGDDSLQSSLSFRDYKSLIP